MTINTRIKIIKVWTNDLLGQKGHITDIYYTEIDGREVLFYRISFDSKKIPPAVFCETQIQAL